MSSILQIAEAAGIAVVTKDGLNIQYLKYNTPAVCMAAVKQNGEAIQFIRDRTPELCRAAVEQNPMAIKYITMQSPELCLMAMRGCKCSEPLPQETEVGCHYWAYDLCDGAPPLVRDAILEQLKMHEPDGITLAQRPATQPTAIVPCFDGRNDMPCVHKYVNRPELNRILDCKLAAISLAEGNHDVLKEIANDPLKIITAIAPTPGMYLTALRHCKCESRTFSRYGEVTPICSDKYAAFNNCVHKLIPSAVLTPLFDQMLEEVRSHSVGDMYAAYDEKSENTLSKVEFTSALLETPNKEGWTKFIGEGEDVEAVIAELKLEIADKTLRMAGPSNETSYDEVEIEEEAYDEIEGKSSFCSILIYAAPIIINLGLFVYNLWH